MSGPWDRPSQDREPTASQEDAAQERPDSGQPPSDAWPPSDPWSDRRPEAGSGWDDWSTLRAPDDFVVDEPVSTLGDPWAESWAEENADREAPSRPVEDERWEPGPPDRPETPDPDRWTPPVEEPDPWSAPPPAGEAEPAATAEPEGPVWQPEPASDAWASAAMAEPATTHDEPPAVTEESEAPTARVAPWQPSDDPWAAVVEPDEPVASEASLAAEEQPDEAPAVMAAKPEAPEEIGAEAAATGEAEASGGWRRDLLPAWLTGRSAAAATEPSAEDAAADEAIAEPEAAEIDGGIDAEPVVAEPVTEPLVAEAEAEPAAEPPAEPEPSAVAFQPESSVAEPEAAPSAADPIAKPIGPVAWEEDDAPAPVGETDATDAEAAAGSEAAADAEAAAELEAPATSVTDAWPESDTATAATAAAAHQGAESADDIEDTDRDQRFDAFLGASVIGAAAAGHTPEATSEALGAPAAESEPAAEPGAAAERASAAAPEPAAEPEAAAGPEPVFTVEPADAEAWVAEPDPWEQVATTPEPPDPAVPVEPEPEADDPAAAWKAAAAAAAAAAVVRTPDVEPTRADVEPAASADTTEPAMDSEAQAPPGDDQAAWRPEWLPDVEEIEADERTSVLPTDWTPPTVPVAPVDRSDLAPHAGATRTRPATDAERDLDEDEDAATTAEQAVPWLIGFILLLAGMVIVLLALIFAGDASLGGGSGEPTPLPSLAGGAVGSAEPTATPPASVAPSTAPASAVASATPAPSGEAVAAREFGPLEMIFQGRAAALAPIYLLHREFTTEPEPTVLAQDPNLDLRRYGWAMDGSKGAGLYADLLVSIEPGTEKRQLADEIATITFGPTPATVYAVRITPDGANDIAVVLAVDFESGDASELARFTYPRPPANTAAPLQQAQYEDEGGAVRLYWMEDNQLRLWVLNGGMWEIDPTSGEATEVPREPPVLWSPDGRNRIEVSESGGTSTLTWIDMEGDERSTTTVEGFVSHLRWSPESDRIVFTVGRSASGGGVLQDLWLWDLGEDPPTQITATGAAFGAEWMGSRVRWREGST
jgi:hypothetical protein